jgi:hypothetical protein
MTPVTSILFFLVAWSLIALWTLSRARSMGHRYAHDDRAGRRANDRQSGAKSNEYARASVSGT